MVETLFVILNLVILESLLSIDNAAVLAVMVKDLPGKQAQRALKWGMIGAYVFRGLCLLFASWLIGIWWLAGVGGLYLIWLGYGHFTKANDTIEEGSEAKDSRIFRWARKIGLNKFWATVVLVEIMDLAFSIDNVFAAVALSDQLWVVCVGVFIGIAAMRLVSGFFLKLLQKYPTLENSAFIVIILLGIKLVMSSVAKGIEWTWMMNLMDHHSTDMIFSACMMLVFFVPFLFKKKEEQEITIESYDLYIGELAELKRVPKSLRSPRESARILEITAILDKQVANPNKAWS